MFDFVGSPVRVRPDLRYAYLSLWDHFARPGPTLTGEQRVAALGWARNDAAASSVLEIGLARSMGRLADDLYHRPAGVDESHVRSAAEEHGEPMTVEVIGLISMLSAVDGTHRGLGADLEPLPPPFAGDPTGEIVEGLKRRRTHIPMPPGPIPVALDLLPVEGAAFQSLFGPQYMTGMEMTLDDFRRSPGLDRAQMEVVSSRTSMINECFY